LKLRSTLALVIVALFATLGCKARFESSVTLGGVEIPAHVLNRGYALYSRHCARCHASKGHGKTTAQRSDRPPRDLTLGIYKYASVIDGGLPTDDDLRRIIKRGLRGNLMPAYPKLSDSDATALVHYLKTLAPRWLEDRAGSPITIGADPWPAGSADAAERGKAVYHGVAQCWSCHPSYLSRPELEAATPKPLSIRDNLHAAKMVKTDYGQLRSPDLKKDTLIAVHAREDLFRIIATGIPGTPMPSWIDSLGPKDVWALVRYVESLRASR
jgi:mono/diheme cytochrome c family protein